jgi:AcrR family transcriptional regulator
MADCLYMGRPKCFNRTEVMEKAIPVFWQHGFAGTSVKDLEEATAVNKSGLYSEFKDKEDLFLSSLKHYVAQTPVLDILKQEPLGWKNIQNFLTVGQTCSGRKGCFLVNSAREVGDLPPSAKKIMNEHLESVRNAIAANVKAGGSTIAPISLADMILTFQSGMSVQQNFGVKKEDAVKRIADFLSAIRG